MKTRRPMLHLAIVAVLSVSLVGCATLKSFFCSNYDTIEAAISAAEATVTVIETQFPNTIPAEYLVVYNAAKAVIATGLAALNSKFCPTAADVASVEAKSVVMKGALKTARVVR